MKLLIGYCVIIFIHFSIKGCNYSQMKTTRGVVVDERTFEYGQINNAGKRDIVPYPIAIFKGPTTTREIKKYLYKPEEHNPFTKRQTYTIKNNTIVESHKVYESTYVDTNLYMTATPWGAYFFCHYTIGDSINVIYDPRVPDEGIVLTFFSYWMTLPAICMIVLFSLTWTGIYRISRIKSDLRE